MFSETTLLNYESYLYAAVFVIVVLILLIVEAEHRWKAKGVERAKTATYALLTAFIVVTASTAVFIIAVELQGDRREYVYSATLENRDRVGVVLLPVSGNEALQDRIAVTSGDGEVSIVETEHGRALRLEFRGDVTVKGRITLDHPVDDWGPTMFNYDSRRSAWISMEPGGAWMGIVVLDLDLGNYNLPGHDALYQIDTTLVEGWDLYKVTSGSE